MGGGQDLGQGARRRPNIAPRQMRSGACAGAPNAQAAAGRRGLRSISVFCTGSLEEARKRIETGPVVRLGSFVIEVPPWMTPMEGAEDYRLRALPGVGASRYNCVVSPV